MKAFNTPEYIKPVIQAIKETYKIITDKHIKVYFDTIENKCSLVIAWTDENKFRGIYKGLPLDYLPEFKKVYAKIDNFAEAASTYPGELDEWSDREKLRFNETVKQSLIELY